MSKKDFDERKRLIDDGKKADNKTFAEQRNNYLLHIGEHWKKVSSDLDARLKKAQVSEQSRVRLTKNHIQVVTKTYINGIISEAPGVQVVAYNTNELADTKDAQLSQAVWKDAEEKLNFNDKILKLATSFIVGGEIATFTYWNPNKGGLKGCEQEVDDNGVPLFEQADGMETSEPVDMMTGQPNQPKASDKPVFNGMLCTDIIHPFNLIRPENAESMADAEWLCIEDMVSISDAKGLVNAIEDDEERAEKLEMIQESSETTFKVFDTNKGSFTDSKDKVLIRKHFYRPCYDYPLGYFYISTEFGDLFEGTLPFAEVLGDEAFPINFETLDEVPTHPRGFSIIKPLRAPQANLNSLASQAAYHAMVMGDDKIITRTGAKLTKGSQWAGIREFSVAGDAPTVIAGRAGEQFDSSIARETAELYKLANMDMEMSSKPIQDVQAMLYSNLSQRKKYSLYVSKFERFLTLYVRKYLAFARVYLPDDAIIKAIGKREAVNIAEFKNTSDIGCNIKLKAMSQDLDSMFGKLQEIQFALQYLGKDLPPEVMGKLLKAMPFLNKDEALSDLNLDDENVTNDILALDRGEMREANPSDNHSYYIKKLTNRMKQSDFNMLAPQIQALYQQKKQAHVQAEAEQAAKMKAMQAEFIPTGGALVTCSMHIQDPGSPGGTRQLRLPYESLMDLSKKLEAQGSGQAALGQQDQATQLEIMQKAQMMAAQQGQPQQQQGNGMPQAIPQGPAGF